MSYHSILLYKPYNVLSQFTNPDGLDCRTLGDFVNLPDLDPKLYSVGRLDRDSEGLLLLTNHGALKHRLSHPQFRHPRTYWVQVERIPDEGAIAQLCRGVCLSDGQTRPAQVTLLAEEPDLPPRDPPIRFRKSVPTAWLEMTLTEGRNRQVRRMTAAVGFPTLRLVRVAIGLQSASAQRNASVQPLVQPLVQAQFTLAGLQPGEWRDLEPTEQQILQRLVRG